MLFINRIVYETVVIYDQKLLTNDKILLKNNESAIRL
jgi:hypothetical protein